jgi:hypothetical protein
MATLCSTGSPNRFPVSDGAATLTSINFPDVGRRAASCPKARVMNKVSKTMLMASMYALLVVIVCHLKSLKLTIVGELNPGSNLMRSA